MKAQAESHRVFSRTKADPIAVAAAREVQESTQADCIILFGSRAGNNWNEQSDLDLMILTQEMPDQNAIIEAQWQAFLIAEKEFGRPVGVDLLFMTRDEFTLMSQGNTNHVAARALREGLIMPRGSEEYRNSYGDEFDQDEQLGHQERQRRVGDTNLHYRNMHALLDMGFEDKNTAYTAHQALEHAMKALITTVSDQPYNTHHSTRAFAADLRRMDPQGNWHFASNLGQLDNFAGASRYGPVLTPVADYREMANNVTEDVDRMYERIKELTGEDCWNVPPDG